LLPEKRRRQRWLRAKEYDDYELAAAGPFKGMCAQKKKKKKKKSARATRARTGNVTVAETLPFAGVGGPGDGISTQSWLVGRVYRP
jgi:hypothetical protein